MKKVCSINACWIFALMLIFPGSVLLAEDPPAIQDQPASTAPVPPALRQALATSLSEAASFDKKAISTTSTGCGRSSKDNYTIFGPLTVAAQDSCDFSASNPEGYSVVASNVLTSFGPVIPKIGIVDTTASASATGTDEHAPVGKHVGGGAEAGGTVTYYFTVEEIRTPPATYAPKVYFEANGSATLQGFATGPGDFNYEGNAGAVATLPDGTEWVIQGEISDLTSSSWSDEIVQSINLDLSPNGLGNPFYEVSIAAGCYVAAWTGADFTSWAECQAVIDPTIRFNQEAFDAQYGSDSFQLSEYYALSFSENVIEGWIFSDGFESGDTTAWSNTVP